MKLFKIELKIESPLVTPLKGDTIWGHFAWGIANHEGEAGVLSFIEDCKKKEPAFITSSAFPKGYICKRIPQITERKEAFSLEDYTNIKKQKKEKYEAASPLIFIKDSEEESVVDTNQISFKQKISTHNTISRITGNVQEGGLYSVSELWANQKDFDLYILSSYSEDRILKLCEWAFENGFGADSSTGKGSISIDIKLQEVQFKNNGNTYMALAPFVVPDLNTIEDLRADIFVRSGKIGGAFVNELSPFKKTVILYDEGAVFRSKTSIQFIGTLLQNIHNDKRICQSAFAPVIPID